jgi:O-antigen polysaccharide polymerase Wzy
MDLAFVTFFLGIIALLMWFFIWNCASKGDLGWFSPISLFAIGLIVFYIIPPLYWQFSSWNYIIHHYLEGLPLVLTGVIIIGLPFIFVFFRKERQKSEYSFRENMDFSRGLFGSGLWICLIPVLLGLGWRIHLITLGHQGRLARTMPVLFGSQPLAYLVGNIGAIYCSFYFAMVLLGNKRQRQIGIAFWVVDGVLQMMTLHRYSLLIFALNSFVLMSILGIKISRKKWISLVVFGIFVIVIIGRTAGIAREYVKISGNTHLSVYETCQVVLEGARTSFSYNENESKSSLLTIADNTMYRLYDARSASAVMMNVPDVIPYYYGRTFLQIFYSLIPRYFWTEKPSLGNIHRVTIEVMPDDSGVNPTGTIAELYMNFSFIGVFGGGVVCFFLCCWLERVMLRKRFQQYAWFCVYPLMVSWIVGANWNFTQRISEMIRLIVFVYLFSLFLGMIRKKDVAKNSNNHAQCEQIECLEESV